jgi:hypothetical protein
MNDENKTRFGAGLPPTFSPPLHRQKKNTPFAEISNGVGSPFLRQAATPLGLCIRARVPQGSSFLATLGYETQSLWDCRSSQPSTAAHAS